VWRETGECGSVNGSVVLWYAYRIGCVHLQVYSGWCICSQFYHATCMLAWKQDTLHTFVPTPGLEGLALSWRHPFGCCATKGKFR